jgi:hypothetical protein
MEPMDSFANAIRSQEGNGTPGGVEPGSIAWARRRIEEVKAGLKDDPGRAYSVEFTAAAEVLREHDPVQFNSLRRLLKDKQVRLGEFDRLVDQRRRERVEDRKRNRAVAAARSSRAAHSIGHGHLQRHVYEWRMGSVMRKLLMLLRVGEMEKASAPPSAI